MLAPELAPKLALDLAEAPLVLASGLELALVELALVLAPGLALGLVLVLAPALQ